MVPVCHGVLLRYHNHPALLGITLHFLLRWHHDLRWWHPGELLRKGCKAHVSLLQNVVWNHCFRMSRRYCGNISNTRQDSMHRCYFSCCKPAISHPWSSFLLKWQNLVRSASETLNTLMYRYDHKLKRSMVWSNISNSWCCRLPLASLWRRRKLVLK